MKHYIIISSGWINNKQEAWISFQQKADKAVQEGYIPHSKLEIEASNDESSYYIWQPFYFPSGLIRGSLIESDKFESGDK